MVADGSKSVELEVFDKVLGKAVPSGFVSCRELREIEAWEIHCRSVIDCELIDSSYNICSVTRGS